MARSEPPADNLQNGILDDRYEMLVRLSPDALYVLQDGRIKFVNSAGIRLLGATVAEEVIGLPIEEFVDCEFIDRVMDRIAHMHETGKPALPMEQRYRRRDGSIVDVEACGAPFLYEGRPATQTIARDITERKATEVMLRTSEERHRVLAAEANRARASLHQEKQILEMIALGKPLADILRSVCLGVENLLSEHRRCSILLLDANRTHLQVGAAPSLPEAYSQAIHGIPVGPAAGSCGAAIHYGRQIIVEDIANDPLCTDCREIALRHDLRACWSTPIPGSSGTAIGAFAVYGMQPGAPNPEALALISDITHLVGIAIQKDQIERSLQESEDRYRSVVTCLTEGILLQSRDGQVLACNPSAERILRLTPDSVDGLRRGNCFRRVVDENGVEIPETEWPSLVVLRTGAPILNLTVGVELHDGELVWISENALPIRRPGETEPSTVLISFTDIRPAKAAQQRLQFMATHDALTGLPNRVFLMERLSQSLDRLRGNGEKRRKSEKRRLAVLFLDLDRFKNVNDTMGHEAGDRLLRIVAERLASCIRASDVLVRLGGDEFVILVDDFENVSAITAICDRALESISVPFRIDDNEYFLGVSIGVAVYPEDGDDGATLLRCADSAMYYAKECGRNNYRFFTRQLSMRTQRRYLLEKNLRRALAQQEFRLLYQPKVDLHTGRIIGAEALLRWDNPDVGLVAPGDFIPIAEETGLIVTIGQWVLEEACRQAATWRKRRAPHLRIAINLSARQFQDEILVGCATDILRRTGLEPCALELEITESLLMGDTDKLMPVFEAFTAMGVVFSIDDFGTGYSSLSYLQQFPIEQIKIDRSFINGIPGSRDSIALTQAIIAMAKALDMRVIAEGVESQEQMEFLKRVGCHEVQGFHFSPPLSPEEFERLL